MRAIWGVALLTRIIGDLWARYQYFRGCGRRRINPLVLVEPSACELSGIVITATRRGGVSPEWSTSHIS